MLLFILQLEPRLRAVVAAKGIKGLTLPDKTETKYEGFADDVTFLLSTLQSLPVLQKRLRDYCAASGAIINNDKCKGLLIGKFASPRYLNISGYSWSVSELKCLGIYIRKQETPDKNWEYATDKLTACIEHWKKRNLSVFGKTTAWNTYILSTFLYKMNLSPTPPALLDKMNAAALHFFWGKNFDPTRRVTLYSPQAAGGLGLANAKVRHETQQIRVLQKLMNSSLSWCSLARIQLLKMLPGLFPLTIRPPDRTPPFLRSIAKTFLSYNRKIDIEILCYGTAKSIYRSILEIQFTSPPKVLETFPDINLQDVNKNIRHLPIASPIKTLMWKLLHDAVATRTWLEKRNILPENVVSTCPFCQEDETAEHLFTQCRHAKLLWNAIKDEDPSFNPPDLKSLRLLPRTGQKENTILAIAAFSIWKNRNDMIFRKSSTGVVKTYFNYWVKYHSQIMKASAGGEKGNHMPLDNFILRV